MLKILYTKAFLRQFSKLTSDTQAKAKIAIKKFERNPKDPSLKTHKLEGKLSNFYSFSVDFGYRIIFEFGREKTIILLKIGNHDIYK